MRVIVYTKPACPLCDHLLDDLAWVRTQISFDVELHDISTDPVAEERFRYLVPVIEVGGALVYPPHDALRLLNWLAEAAYNEA